MKLVVLCPIVAVATVLCGATPIPRLIPWPQKVTLGEGSFDYEYSKIDTKRAYSYEPIPGDFTPERASHILGVQANFWSHIDRSPELVDRQLFPRLLAIAERGWSAAEVRDWDSFRERIKPNLKVLSRDGANLYPDPSLSGAQ
jgi:N-acetyl-beta-hexosaminidase